MRRYGTVTVVDAPRLGENTRRTQIRGLGCLTHRAPATSRTNYSIFRLPFG
jgi:hypothetical protein